MESNLFVYGSLRPGEEAEKLLGDYQVLEKNKNIIGYRMFVLENYPIAVPDPQGSIWGDVLKVNDKVFPNLDKYEETEKNIYLRLFDETYQFFIYYFLGQIDSTLAEIPGGDWKMRNF
ncbi:MAG: gamma-glutamylcyclotransferase [Leptospira sp.]|nr:gamma-glutamylcyclotransferase [Leptospira sp.]